MISDKLKAPWLHEGRDAMDKLMIRAEYAGIGESVGSFWMTLDSVIQNEMESRRIRLLESPRFHKEKLEKTKYLKKERDLHAKSVKQIQKTLKTFRKERKRLSKKRTEEMDAFIKSPKKFQRVRNATIESLQDGLLTGEIDPDIAEEIVDIFEEMFDSVDTSQGISGFYDQFEVRLEELEQMRNKRNRGLKHNPLPPWKIAAIIALGVVAAILLWNCVTRSDQVFIACINGIVSGAKAITVLGGIVVTKAGLSATLAAIKGILMFC